MSIDYVLLGLSWYVILFVSGVGVGRFAISPSFEDASLLLLRKRHVSSPKDVNIFDLY